MPFAVILGAFLLFNKISDSSAENSRSLEWWQTGVIYQIFPRSFKDSDGDGIGDLKGIEDKIEYLQEIGVSAVWLSPIFESPMVDFGYDVSDYYNIAKIFGSIEDFKSLKQKLDSSNIRLILDFVPNHSSDQCEWFKKSVEKQDPYTNYYVWKDPFGWNGSTPIPPNNWVSLFNGPAWKYNKQRKQFYLHQFAEQQPDFNFRCDELVEEMERIIIFWLNQGVDGFRMDSVAYMLEHPDFPDEPKNENFTTNIVAHESLLHPYSKDWLENYELTKFFENIVQRYSEKDGKHRVVIHEAYTTFEYTMKFYGKSRGRHMPFNFLLITDVNDHSNAREFSQVVLKWLKNMPEKSWANWVIGNHDNSRVGSRFSPELVDGMNMINLLLPGTAITYNGEEIGMTDGKIRWDQTLDPGALLAGFEHFLKFTRDPARTPFQWDSTPNAGFTKNSKSWLPVNTNYWRLNLDAQKKTNRSHFQIYKQLVNLRSHLAVQYGDLKIYPISDWVFLFTREIEEDKIVVVINLGSDMETIILRDSIQQLPEVLSVYTRSVNSEYDISDILKTSKPGFEMRPQSSLVLTTNVISIKSEQNKASWFSSIVMKYVEPLFFILFKFIN